MEAVCLHFVINILNTAVHTHSSLHEMTLFDITSQVISSGVRMDYGVDQVMHRTARRGQTAPWDTGQCVTDRFQFNRLMPKWYFCTSV